jgi:hypothetical protein
LSGLLTASTDEEKEFTYDSKGKRDPFVSVIATRVENYASLENIENAEDLILEGIIWDPKGESVAILNGVILKEGDVVSTISILKIAPDKITLTINNREHEITLEEKEEWR